MWLCNMFGCNYVILACEPSTGLQSPDAGISFKVHGPSACSHTFFTYHSSPLSGVNQLVNEMYDNMCLQSLVTLAGHRPFCPTLDMLGPVSRGTPPAFLHGDSWLWLRQVTLTWPSENKSGLTVHQHPLGPSFSSPLGALTCLHPDCLCPLMCHLCYRWTAVKSVGLAPASIP